MKTVHVDSISRPCIEDDILCLPTIGSCRWVIIATGPITVCAALKWARNNNMETFTDWVFFANEKEIPWDRIPDKVSIAHSCRKWSPLFHPDDVIPWGDDIETLVALERS